MHTQPANVADTTSQLIAAGIAERMLVEGHQAHLPDKPSACKFWVQIEESQGMTIMQVVVGYPPYDRVQTFRAIAGKPFGNSDRPLNREQQELVNRLALEWKQSFSVSV